MGMEYDASYYERLALGVVGSASAHDERAQVYATLALAAATEAAGNDTSAAVIRLKRWL